MSHALARPVVHSPLLVDQVSPLVREAFGLPYRSPQLQVILGDGLGANKSMQDMLLRLVLPTARAYNEIMARHDGDPSGIEFRHARYDNYAFVLADASMPGNYRVQTFDARGFYTHYSFATLELAVDELVNLGYVIEMAGVLHRLAAADLWQQGMAQLEFLGQLNRGDISYEAYKQKLAALGFDCEGGN